MDNYADEDYDNEDEEESEDDLQLLDFGITTPDPQIKTLPYPGFLGKPGFVSTKSPVITGKPAEPAKNKGDLPVFIKEPVDAYVIKGKPAVLKCYSTGAQKSYFTCNGEAMAQTALHSERDFVDKQGQVVKEVTLEVGRDQVEEVFGNFYCHCEAWSSKGKTTSRKVTVETACKSI